MEEETRPNGLTYHAVWSGTFRQYVGLCDQRPGMAYMAPEFRDALRGIMDLVAEEQRAQRKIDAPDS